MTRNRMVARAVYGVRALSVITRKLAVECTVLQLLGMLLAILHEHLAASRCEVLYIVCQLPRSYDACRCAAMDSEFELFGARARRRPAGSEARSSSSSVAYTRVANADKTSSVETGCSIQDC